MAIYIRALRLPFVSASALPFILGALIDQEIFRFLPFFLGLVSVIATHLGANLMNDYADSKSGADWHDKRFYGFFGGSKLIQEGALSEHFYLYASLFCFSIAFVSICLWAALSRNMTVFLYLFAILFLGFTYSHKPFQFSYHRLGEVVLFLLFGPALVMGGYFIMSQRFPTVEGFLLSLPFGFFTTAILFANEVPDYPQDHKAGKMTWVSLVGPSKAFVLYFLLEALGFISILVNILLGYLPVFAGLSCGLIILAFKAGKILKQSFDNKEALVQSSQLTIAIQALASIVLIAGVLFR